MERLLMKSLGIFMGCLWFAVVLGGRYRTDAVVAIVCFYVGVLIVTAARYELRQWVFLEYQCGLFRRRWRR